MRSTDVCHPNELRVPAPRVFPARGRRFRGGDAPRSLRLRTAWPGESSVSRRSETASADRSSTRTSWTTPRGLSHERGRFLLHGADAIEPLTPLSRLDLPSSASLTFARAASSPCGGLLAVSTGRRTSLSAEDQPWKPRVTETIRDGRGCLPSARDPSWDPVVVTTPVPRARHRFRRCRTRWMTLSRHPGPCAGPLPSWAVRPTRDTPFARRARRRFHPPTDPPS